MKIDWLLKTARNKLKDVNLQELLHEEILKKVKAKLSLKYHDYLDMFDWAMTNQLLFHHFYDHKIELINERISSWSHLYHIFDYKLQKMKSYLIKHLNKDLIFFSSMQSRKNNHNTCITNFEKEHYMQDRANLENSQTMMNCMSCSNASLKMIASDVDMS